MPSQTWLVSILSQPTPCVDAKYCCCVCFKFYSFTFLISDDKIIYHLFFYLNIVCFVETCNLTKVRYKVLSQERGKEREREEEEEEKEREGKKEKEWRREKERRIEKKVQWKQASECLFDEKLNLDWTELQWTVIVLLCWTTGTGQPGQLFAMEFFSF